MANSTLERPGLWIRRPRRVALAAPEVEVRVAERKRSLAHRFPVRDQNSLSCCVSAALVAAMEIRGARLVQRGLRRPFRLSALQHYYYSRGAPRPDGSLASLTLERGLQCAQNGVLSFDEFPTASPMTRADAIRRPPRSGRKNAFIAYDEETRTDGFEPIGRSPAEWVSWLDRKCPIVIGVFLPRHYWEVVRRGEASTLDTSGDIDRTREGHALVVRGYQSRGSTVRFRVLDSFGLQNGDGGGWWLPARGLSAVVHQAWIITYVEFR